MVLIRTAVLLFLSIALCNAQQSKYKIIWEEDLPKGIEIFFQDDFLFSKETLSIRLAGSDKKMLAEKVSNDSSVIFTPVIPFSFQLEYDLYSESDFLFSFTLTTSKSQPFVKAIYPMGDTIPENFLKLYLVFDQPMGEGRANEHVKVFHNGKEVENAFLLLQPELWNVDHTVLTMWLEPGRIKRDLGPNKEQGPILKEGNTYEVVVDEQFKSVNGKSLQTEFRKIYYVGKRDVESPNINKWKLEKPKSDTSSLTIQFDEPAALEVAVNAIKVKFGEEYIEGKFTIINDRDISFSPTYPWKKGNYTIEIESRFEDLAGNNLNRLFDMDLNKNQSLNRMEIYVIQFSLI